MLSEKETTKISKFLSLVLRHQPETIGLTLDEQGWADVQELLQKMQASGSSIDMDILNHVVDTNNKKRFAFNEDQSRIRASQGHSVEVELGYTAQTPPDISYHGTGNKSVESILATGIEKRDRHHVHLSADIETAIKVGQRHGKPVVFEVLAGQMAKDGLIFYISENGVWLTDYVAVGYIRMKGKLVSKIRPGGMMEKIRDLTTFEKLSNLKSPE